MSTSGVAERGEFEKALSVDQHGIEPIPESDRDSTSWQQFWIWFGANITPTSWVVGAIGPELGLSLVQSIVLMLVGQAAGALIFGFFTLMGKRTGVSQLALGRMAFGRRGNNVPSILQALITLSWIGLNTYVVLSLATYCLHKLGLPNNHAVEYTVAAVIMIAQLIVGTLGFYAIRTFEKWTVPVLARDHGRHDGAGLRQGPHRLEPLHRPRLGPAHRGHRVHDRRRDRLGLLVGGVGLGLLALHPPGGHRAQALLGLGDRHLHPDDLARRSWVRRWRAPPTNADPAELVASLFGVMTIPVLIVIIHGAVAVNIESVYSAPLCMLAGGIKLKRWVGSVVTGDHRQRRADRLPGLQHVRHLVHQLHELVRDLDGGVGRDHPARLLRHQPGPYRPRGAVRRSPDLALRRHPVAGARRRC